MECEIPAQGTLSHAHRNCLSHLHAVHPRSAPQCPGAVLRSPNGVVMQDGAVQPIEQRERVTSDYKKAFHSRKV